MLAFAKIKSMAGGLLAVEKGSHKEAGPQRWHQHTHTHMPITTRPLHPSVLIALTHTHAYTPPPYTELMPKCVVTWGQGGIETELSRWTLEGTVCLTKLCWTSGKKQYWLYGLYYTVFMCIHWPPHIFQLIALCNFSCAFKWVNVCVPVYHCLVSQTLGRYLSWCS